MRIIVIGASGTIGSAVVRALGVRHEVISVSRNTQPPIDIEDPATVDQYFHSISTSAIDAVVSCAGTAAFRPIADLTEEDFAASFRSKLLGQIRVIRAAFDRVRDGGSITVTSGVLAQRPIPGSGAVSLVNAGLEGFVRAAALEAPSGIRVNVVSPPWLKPTLEKLHMDPSQGVSAEAVAKAYVAAVEGKQTGQTIRVETA